jgi:hypothetical protein
VKGVAGEPPWIQLPSFGRVDVLLILPCNAAACVGNYFRAEVYRKSGWNTWREADAQLRALRSKGRVAFAAVDSSILETAPDDPRGAIVLETEMDRARNSEGEDWGAPSWRWFRPSQAGRWTQLTALTEALIRGVQRVEGLGLRQVFALVNPRAYFLALAAAVRECGLLDHWVLFRVPAHPRHLRAAVREVAPIVRAAVAGVNLAGGIYPIPSLIPSLQCEMEGYGDPLPGRWRAGGDAISAHTAKSKWMILRQAAGARRGVREAPA